MIKNFITVAEGRRGFFAVHMWLNDMDYEDTPFWEPWEAGLGRYATFEEAEREAKWWAEQEEMEYRA